MFITWDCLCTPYFHESLQLLLEIKQVSSILPYIFHLQVVMTCLPLSFQTLICENSNPAKRNKFKHKTPSTHCGPIFIKGLVSSTHILQGIFSSWNKEKLCSPGARKFSLPRASIVSPYFKRKIFPEVYVCCSLVLK